MLRPTKTAMIYKYLVGVFEADFSWAEILDYVEIAVRGRHV